MKNDNAVNIMYELKIIVIILDMWEFSPNNNGNRNIRIKAKKIDNGRTTIFFISIKYN